MKVFITGVAGFLGSHLADLMISEGHKVAGNDNMIGGYVDNVPQDVEFHQVVDSQFWKLNCIIYYCS